MRGFQDLLEAVLLEEPVAEVGSAGRRMFEAVSQAVRNLRIDLALFDQNQQYKKRHFEQHDGCLCHDCGIRQVYRETLQLPSHPYSTSANCMMAPSRRNGRQ